MKPSYEELQTQVQALTTQRDGLIDELNKTQDEALDARAQRDALTAQVEVFRQELQSASDWFSAYWDNLNAEQRDRLKQMDSVAKSTPAACLVQVRADAVVDAIDWLSVSYPHLSSPACGLLTYHAERIRQGGAV